jgi:hypothetical protein
MVLPSTPMDGCLSASTRVYAGILCSDSWWPTPHIPSSGWTSSLISASWWTAETAAYWTESCCCLPRHKQPVHWSQAWRPLVMAHRSTASSPNSGTSLAQQESSTKCATALSTTSGLYLAHRSPSDHGDWHRTGWLSPKPRLTSCCEMAQLAAQRVPSLLLYTSCPRRTVVCVLAATTEH